MFTTAAFKLTAKASLNAVSVKNRSREENGKISQNCTENCRFRAGSCCGCNIAKYALLAKRVSCTSGRCFNHVICKTLDGFSVSLMKSV